MLSSILTAVQNLEKEIARAIEREKDAHVFLPRDPDYKPTPQEAEIAFKRMSERERATHERVALLDPNRNSDIKIERYVFSLNPVQFSQGEGLKWGVLNGWTAFKSPQVPFRAERLVLNVPIRGLVYLNTIQAANINAQIGGIADAYSFNANSQNAISLPVLLPQNTMQVAGTWTNVVPSPYRENIEFVLCIDFFGWATIIA